MNILSIPLWRGGSQEMGWGLTRRPTPPFNATIIEKDCSMVGDILLCSDNEDITCPLMEVLRRDGYEVQTAVRGMDAVQKALSGRFSVLILSLDVERGKGAYLVPVVNALDETIAIITVTEKDSLQLQRLARQGRIFFHAVWPQDGDAILAAVKNAEASRAREQAPGIGGLATSSPGYLKKKLGKYIGRVREEPGPPLSRRQAEGRI